jgi:hypothetical protein
MGHVELLSSFLPYIRMLKKDSMPGVRSGWVRIGSCC